jgi:predicted deacylase
MHNSNRPESEAQTRKRVVWLELSELPVQMPGRKVFGTIRVGTQSDGTVLEVPVCLASWLQPGPTLYVQAAVHGAEINGVEVLRRC